MTVAHISGQMMNTELYASKTEYYAKSVVGSTPATLSFYIY